LRVQTALLDELFESAPEAIVMLDLQERVTRVNREFTRMFGYAAAEAQGRPLGRLIVPDDLLQEAERMARSVAQGQHASGETECLRKDGARLHVSVLGAPILTATGQIASYAIYRDITERRLAEAERTKLETRLRQAEKLEAIGTMAGGIAHDFNNILAAILGYGDMALNAAPEGTLKRYVGNVISAAHRARALVDQILSYSRSTHGKHVVVDVGTLVEETLELVRASLPADIELHARLTESQTAVIADPTHIHQLVMNLCTNAVHAMDQGGTLSVTLDAVATPFDRTLSHGLLAAGQHVRMGVHDTGCGMEPAVVERIFEPFFTTKESGTGTGLGLALVHGIVSELGGVIDVASRPGRGSAFELYLPRTDAAAMEKAETESTLPRGSGERILLVEDEKPLMLLAEEMLAALSYEPAGFTRAAEALAEFRADPRRFDMVALDHLMPGMTGIELAKHLRIARSDIPIVLISGYTGPLLNQQALSAGIDEILTKPLDFRQLAEAMARVLTRETAR
jgi:PAS domain S-box-containing protein